MKIFKNLFCKHIWKEVDREFLREARLPFGALSNGLQTYSNFELYAVTYKCVKCGKTKIDEMRVLII